MAPLLVSSTSFGLVRESSILIVGLTSIVLLVVGIFVCGCCKKEPKRQRSRREPIKSLHESAPLESTDPSVITPGPNSEMQAPSPPTTTLKTTKSIMTSPSADHAQSLKLTSMRPGGASMRHVPRMKSDGESSNRLTEAAPSLQLMANNKSISPSAQKRDSWPIDQKPDDSIIGGRPTSPSIIGGRAVSQSPPSSAPKNSFAPSKPRSIPKTAAGVAAANAPKSPKSIVGYGGKNENVSVSSFNPGSQKPGGMGLTKSLAQTSAVDDVLDDMSDRTSKLSVGPPIPEGPKAKK